MSDRSELTYELALQEKVPSWALPSRCKRPPLKPVPTLFARILARLGRKS